MSDHFASPQQSTQPWSLTRRRALQAAGGLAVGTAVGTLPNRARANVVEGSAELNEGTNFAVAASPDGRQLALDLTVSIWVVDARGGEARRLTDDLQDATRPRWSPDGRTIAFQSYRDGNFHLWTIRADGGHLASNDSEEPPQQHIDLSMVLSMKRCHAQANLTPQAQPQRPLHA